MTDICYKDNNDSLLVQDVMAICGCCRESVIRWIKLGYLPAKHLDPNRYRSAYAIKKEDLEAFLKSEHHYGHPEDIKGSRPFTRIPILEDCYPINLLNSVRQINLDSEEVTPDIWDYDIRQFRNLITQLTDQEQRVLEMRYHLGMTLDETSVAIGKTRERVRQIQVKAERKLRHWLGLKGCRVVTRDVYNKLLDDYRELSVEYEKLRAQLEKTSSLESVSEPKVGASMISLECMDLSIRSYNCLKRAGINTLKDVLEFDMNQKNPPSENWLTIRNLGKKSLMEIAKKIFDYCQYRIQYFYNDDFQGYVPIVEEETLVPGNVDIYGGKQ